MAIKLFGKTIQMTSARQVLEMDRDESSEDDEKAASNQEYNHEPKGQYEEAPNSSSEEERSDEQNFSAMNEEEADPGALAAEKDSKFDQVQSKEGDSSMDKSLKKPNKILPCPRCNSMDTKFCYYNNYNVNQPRHFCKNCQRYWTAGGNMRNVPVGAGRRKSKASDANHHYCNIRVHDCSDDDLLDSIHHSSHLKPNGRLLSFGPGAALCQSTASVLGPVEKKTKKSCTTPNEKDQLSGSLASTLNSNNESNRATNSNLYGFPPFLNGTQLPNLWTNTPPFSFPIPFFPVNAFWGMPWLPQPPLMSPPSIDSSYSVQNSSNLGKHTREGSMLNHNNSADADSANSEKCLWIPKTLRIDDPEDAAKCSLWATLGFNKVKADSKNGGEAFSKAFQYNGEHKNNWAEKASQLLCANPAALSRSLGFQERV